jgi:general secretion pathway protein H
MPGQNGLQSGFSLVEVMVTVFILAMATSFVVVTLPPNPSPLLREAKRFEAFVELAAKRSRVGGLPIGLVAGEVEYSLVVWRDEQWNAIIGTSHELDEGIVLGVSTQTVSERPENWPVVVFDPLGAATPTKLELHQAGQKVSVWLHEDGSAMLDQDNG